MDEPRIWRLYVWFAGLVVAIGTGSYTGCYRWARPFTWTYVLASIAMITLAAIAILPAKIPPRQKALRLAISAAIYGAAGVIFYSIQDPYGHGWGALGG
jgi:hypothetical protein